MIDTAVTKREYLPIIRVVLGIVLGLAVTFAYRSVFTNSFGASPMDYGWLVRVAQDGDLYPYESTYIDGQTVLYTPLYFLIVGNLMKVFGLTPIVGKVISTICMLVTAYFIYCISSRLTTRKILAIIPVAMFMLYPFIVDYTANQTKIDLMGLMFSTIGLFLVLNRRYLLSVIPFILAIFTKQYFVSAPIAVGIYLLLKDRKQLAVFAPTLALSFGGGLLLGDIITSGTFTSHVIGFLNAPTFGDMYLRRYLGCGLMNMLYLSPVLSIAVIGMVKKRVIGLLGIYLVVSLVVMFITMGKVGSGLNYTFDSLVASCMLAPLVIKKDR